MLNVEKITPDNVDKLKNLYNEFVERAILDYQFELPPLPYDDFKINISENILKGYFIESDGIPSGFLLYILLNNGIELNIVHESANDKNNKKLLVEKFLQDVKNEYKNILISYPMLGVQADFVQEIAYVGFELAGQAVVEFGFTNPICTQIYNKSETPALSQGYALTSWKKEYTPKAAQVIHETFKNMPDAKFDSRYRTLDGCIDIVMNITECVYGDFLPEVTTVLTYNGEPVGFCFANLTTIYKANIPIVSVQRPHHKQGFGKLMLKNTLLKFFKENQSSKLNVQSINATADTDNYPAMRMYRKVGFKEIYTYPHAYLELK